MELRRDGQYHQAIHFLDGVLSIRVTWDTTALSRYPQHHSTAVTPAE
jgi:hypothetical protein